eukprot:TRINITY_DN7272_c0_g1_i12.p1 TRINITY_DN7272_c0_g1~~TRINITY_DN7272_c0_g1_i12.p1  ORF type:complete len:179 (-),score=65.24 TRINITY_DN7272_c0_g1_i12:112-648(-)
MSKKFKNLETINSELLTVTYGTLMMQLLKDYVNHEEVNGKIEEIGVNIGSRLVDEYLAKSDFRPCKSRREIAENIVNGFDMFLGIAPRIEDFKNEDKEFVIAFGDNAFTDLVELPDPSPNYTLIYANVICGIIRGAFKTLNITVKCNFIKDKLKGDAENKIAVVIEQEAEDKREEDKQ